MSKAKKYTEENKRQILDLVKDNFSDSEIADITDFHIAFIRKITTEYWNRKTNNLPSENIDLRKKFNEAFRLPIADKPKLILNDRYLLQHALMKEELTEYFNACLDRDLIEVADALTDMQEILYGMFAEHGMLDLHQELYNEVHRSNMSKLNENGVPIYREDGKVMKSALFQKPNIAKVLGV